MQAARNIAMFLMQRIISFNAISSEVQTPFAVHRSCPARTAHYVYSAFEGVRMSFHKVKW